MGQGNIFTSVCQEFCSPGGVPGGGGGWSGPKGVWSREVSGPKGVWSGGCLVQGGLVPGGAWSGGVETPRDGYCCGRYASVCIVHNSWKMFTNYLYFINDIPADNSFKGNSHYMSKVGTEQFC